MAAPKGNKFAVGHGHGAPKTPPETWQERITALIDYAEKEDSFSIYGFAHKYRKPESTVRMWTTLNNDFLAAYEYARELIGERRYFKGLTGEFNASLVEKTHPLYNKGYKEWVREIKDKVKDDSKTINVILPDYSKES